MKKTNVCGVKIRELRVERGLTLKQLADILGFSESTMSQYETGKRHPDYETLLNLAHYFEVSTDFLLGKESYQYSNKLPLLKELRQSRKLSQQDIADHLGITRQAYCNYENGNRTPKMDVLFKLASIFSVSIESLFSTDAVSLPDLDADYIYTSEAAAQAFFFNNCPLPKEIRNNIWAEVKDFAHFKILQAQRSDALKEALIAVGLSDQELTDEMIAETLSFIGFIEKKKAAPKDSDKE